MSELESAESQSKLAEEQTPSEISPLVMHVRCEQASEDVPLDILHVNPSLADEMIREAVEKYFKLKSGCLETCSVERHVNGNMSVLSKKAS